MNPTNTTSTDLKCISCHTKYTQEIAHIKRYICEECRDEINQTKQEKEKPGMPTMPTDTMSLTQNKILGEIAELSEQRKVIEKRLKELEGLKQRATALTRYRRELHQSVQEDVLSHLGHLYDNAIISSHIHSSKSLSNSIDALISSFFSDLEDILVDYHSDYYKTHLAGISLDKT